MNDEDLIILSTLENYAKKVPFIRESGISEEEEIIFPALEKFIDYAKEELGDLSKPPFQNLVLALPKRKLLIQIRDSIEKATPIIIPLVKKYKSQNEEEQKRQEEVEIQRLLKMKLMEVTVEEYVKCIKYLKVHEPL